MWQLLHGSESGPRDQSSSHKYMGSAETSSPSGCPHSASDMSGVSDSGNLQRMLGCSQEA
eukprot:4128400-Alexandrium_andersonii.AAC.1